jgi:hypothetical protein
MGLKEKALLRMKIGVANLSGLISRSAFHPSNEIPAKCATVPILG